MVKAVFVSRRAGLYAGEAGAATAVGPGTARPERCALAKRQGRSRALSSTRSVLNALCPRCAARQSASKPASMRGLCKYTIQLFTGVRLPHPEKIISIPGRSNLVWVSEWISLRVKTSTSVLSYVSTNGRGKRCVLFQLLDGTTVSPPKAIFASGFSS